MSSSYIGQPPNCIALDRRGTNAVQYVRVMGDPVLAWDAADRVNPLAAACARGLLARMPTLCPGEDARDCGPPNDGMCHVKCQRCGQTFPKRTGRFCGSCQPQDETSYLSELRQLRELREACAILREVSASAIPEHTYDRIAAFIAKHGGF